VRIGIIFPQAGLEADPIAVRDFGQAVESLGFTHLLAYDHVLASAADSAGAKQAAYVDRLAQGRLRLGVGVGWNALEYAALDEDFSDRGARIEEQIGVLRLLWAQEVVTTAGRWHHITAAGINPRPLAGRIPIWIGGAAEPVLQRVGRLADGWMPERRHVGPQYADYPHR
jgi:alkanesulfonate monooxygenase SsuD/methylene tetrahydromethanopterin reductase-like flavin-dependent oxidoreductase (luciferase family)